MQLPWYKRAAIRVVIIGAMVIGAIILIFKWFRWNLFRVPMESPPPTKRETADQAFEDEIKKIEKEIEELNHETKGEYLAHGARSIDDVNNTLAKARAERRDRQRDRGTDRRSDSND